MNSLQKAYKTHYTEVRDQGKKKEKYTFWTMLIHSLDHASTLYTLIYCRRNTATCMTYYNTVNLDQPITNIQMIKYTCDNNEYSGTALLGPPSNIKSHAM